MLDHLGSIREMADGTGSIQAEYGYTPYGQVIKLQGGLASDFQYAGYYLHATSGLNLTKYRMYSANLGRWISRDPLGEAEASNVYAYVNGNPISFNDPLGLADSAACCKAKQDAQNALNELKQQFYEMENPSKPGRYWGHVKAYKQTQDRLKKALRKWRLHCDEPPPDELIEWADKPAPPEPTDSTSPRTG